MSTLDTLGDIFTGGFQTALDIEAEKARAEIANKPIAQDTHNVRMSPDPAATHAPASPYAPAGVSPVLLIGGALVAMALFALLLRRG